jgi:hypothetical protein
MAQVPAGAAPTGHFTVHFFGSPFAATAGLREDVAAEDGACSTAAGSVRRAYAGLCVQQRTKGMASAAPSASKVCKQAEAQENTGYTGRNVYLRDMALVFVFQESLRRVDLGQQLFCTRKSANMLA